MKNLIKNNSAVSYLLLVMVGVAVVVIGMLYMFLSEFIGSFDNIYDGTALANVMTSDALDTENLLFIPFKYFLMIAMIVLIYYICVMSQKPEKEW